MQIRPASPGEGSSPSSFLQCAFWGDFKSRFGWQSLRFIIIEGEEGGPALLVLLRPLRFGLSFAYVPHGPEHRAESSPLGPFLGELSEALRPFLPRSCLFIRYDPPSFSLGEPDADSEEEDLAGSENRRASPSRPLVGPPLKKAASDVQVPDTIVVDLSASEDEILSRMKPKWRYNIRLSAKKGVDVVESGADSIPEFYRLYRETAARDKIALHPESYYRQLFEVAEEARSRGDADAPDLRLWIARKDGRSLASIVTLFRGSEAVYLYGASSNEGRELMPAYALQWAAMRAAKSAGCSSYDLFGIPPSGDPGHPMAGLYRFKSGFGGRILRRPGSWDYALRPAASAFFRSAEKARLWWYKDLRKRFRKPMASRSDRAG